MHHTENLPLSVNLDFASQTESPQPQGTTDVGKDGLDNTESLAVSASSLRGVDFLFHLLRVAFRCIGCATREKYHLARQRALGVT
jgi:hypothetical protein